MKKILLALVILFSALSANAYDFDKFSISGGAEVNANYLFRGSVLGGVNVQPWVEFSSYGITLGAWGSVGSGRFDVPDDFNRWNNELDLYLSYTVPGEYVTVKVTHFYYFDRSKFFNYSYKANDEGEVTETSQTEVMLEVKPSSEYPFILSANLQVGGGDCFNANYDTTIWKTPDVEGKKLYSMYISLRYELELGDLYIEPEIGFSPYRSYYTYFNPETGKLAPFALNSISCKVNYNFYSNDYINLYAIAQVHFNLFDVGYEKFAYDKNFGWNVGFGFSL